jgi:hypothetical protein
LGGLALFKVLIHLPFLHRYGYHHDELYFIACGEHLSLGYVDHAPMIPWIARLATTVFSDSLVGLRIAATLAGAATVFLTGLLARRLGGGRFAQAVACMAVIIAPMFLRSGNMLCIPAFEPLIWVGCSHVLVRIVHEDEPRLWSWLGLLAGIGLLTKHSTLFLGVGLVAGLLLTPLRRHFRSPWLYVGGAIALAFFVPNLVWQATHEWPTVGFLRQLNEDVSGNIEPLQFLAGQLLYLHPLGAVVWISGLGFFLGSKAGRPYRVLGWIYVAVFLLLLLSGSKIYYLAPAYPALLAGGGVALERFAARARRGWVRPATVGALALGGAVMAPVSVPMLPLTALERYLHGMTFGAFENVYELTGDLRGMFGWPERVAAVAEVYDGLPAEQREGAVIFAAGYGNAGAIDFLGQAHGLPGAVSLSETYWPWGPPDGPIDTVIGAGYRRETLERIFDDVEEAARVDLENVNPWQTPFLVHVCRNPKVSLRNLWADNRPW